jgi:hypothetical protein
MAVLMAVPVRLGVAPVVALMMLWVQKAGLLCLSSSWRVLGASLDDLVEFPSVEPNTPALWAVVNLDALEITPDFGDGLTDQAAG